MLFQFLYSLLEYFTPPAKYFASMAENPYPAIRDIMTPRRVGRMSTDLWVGAIIEVGITEVNRAQDVLAIRIRSVEQIRLLELHELNIVSLEYDGEVRHYTAERMVEYNPSAPAQTLSARMSHFKGKQVGTRGALDEINSFQSIYEARGYMHKDTGIMESFNVPPTVHLNILHFAVLCQLVSKHCSKLDRLLETMTWLWARSFFVCLRRLCERQHGEPIATARGPAINKMGRLTPAMPRLVTENADVTMSPPEIKKQFLKFFKGSDPREVTVGEEDARIQYCNGYLVDVIMAEFDDVYQTALDELNENAAKITKIVNADKRLADAEQQKAELLAESANLREEMARMKVQQPL